VKLPAQSVNSCMLTLPIELSTIYIHTWRPMMGTGVLIAQLPHAYCTHANTKHAITTPPHLCEFVAVAQQPSEGTAHMQTAHMLLTPYTVCCGTASHLCKFVAVAQQPGEGGLQLRQPPRNERTALTQLQQGHQQQARSTPATGTARQARQPQVVCCLRVNR
jgi:hypothetical protein